MPKMESFQSKWEALSVPERIEAINARKIHPSLRKMSDDFEKKRREGKLPKVDIVPSFIDAYMGMVAETKEGTEEERGIARACMKILKTSARQQLSKRDFSRFMEGIK